jgi:aspartyl-tRNA(Asn)/glutamyl-tRNA(Gln) amidotransferase subunit C
MSISVEEVRRIAQLARLRFTEEDERRLAQDLSKVLDYVRTLDEIDTSDVPPLTRVHADVNVVRSSTPVQRITREEALSQAPDRDDAYFRVPKVIG